MDVYFEILTINEFEGLLSGFGFFFLELPLFPIKDDRLAIETLDNRCFLIAVEQSKIHHVASYISTNRFGRYNSRLGPESFFHRPRCRMAAMKYFYRPGSAHSS